MVALSVLVRQSLADHIHLPAKKLDLTPQRLLSLQFLPLNPKVWDRGDGLSGEYFVSKKQRPSVFSVAVMLLKVPFCCIHGNLGM